MQWNASDLHPSKHLTDINIYSNIILLQRSSENGNSLELCLTFMFVQIIPFFFPHLNSLAKLSWIEDGCATLYLVFSILITELLCLWVDPNALFQTVRSRKCLRIIYIYI